MPRNTEKGLSDFVPFKNLFNEMFSLRKERDSSNGRWLQG